MNRISKSWASLAYREESSGVMEESDQYTTVSGHVGFSAATRTFRMPLSRATLIDLDPVQRHAKPQRRVCLSCTAEETTASRYKVRLKPDVAYPTFMPHPYAPRDGSWDEVK